MDSAWPPAPHAVRPAAAPAAEADSLGRVFWHAAELPRLRADFPTMADSHFVGDNRQCALCHAVYVRAFAANVHGQQRCEDCHGPAVRHVASRGQEPASILSLSRADRITPSGKPTTPGERAEICLRCHEPSPRGTGAAWRSSSHAHHGVECSDCHAVHYNVPPGTPPALLGRAITPDAADPRRRIGFQQPPAHASPARSSLRGTSHNLGAITPATCYRCHGEMQRFEKGTHPHRIGAPYPERPGHRAGTFDCATCHEPHGNIRHATRKNVCLTCHQGNPHVGQWKGSPHDLAGVDCTDCHDPHPARGAPMQVDQPRVCYRCHVQKQQLQEVAHPHQILGPNGFVCTSCHEPHGRITPATRTDLCLRCHTGSPTMAWHSSTHGREDVACTDCHDPHPNSHPVPFAGVNHTSMQRSKRLPMSVDEPNACFKCHPKIYGLASLPSHHPIKEGKLVCSRCHDAHGQNQGNLKTETVNLLCYTCHAEKQGPFVWEHPPVTENCDYCHEPHGTVVNNLLRQPTTFLCLRCHTGHSTHGASSQCARCHAVNGEFINVGGGPRDPMIPTTPDLRQALFTDCTQCHSQVHGSDLPSGFEDGHSMRR